MQANLKLLENSYHQLKLDLRDQENKASLELRSMQERFQIEKE